MESITGKKQKPNKIYAAIIIFILSTIVFLSPIFKNFSYWWQMDWDQFTFWNAIPGVTILNTINSRFGTPMPTEAMSSSPIRILLFLSPFYIFVLLSGPVAGLKLEIIAYLIIGLLGMFLLSNYMKAGGVSSFLSSFVYMLSSIYALHLTEGHTEWLVMAFVPWLFLYYLKGFEK